MEAATDQSCKLGSRLRPDDLMGSSAIDARVKANDFLSRLNCLSSPYGPAGQAHHPARHPNAREKAPREHGDSLKGPVCGARHHVWE